MVVSMIWLREDSLRTSFQNVISRSMFGLATRAFRTSSIGLQNSIKVATYRSASLRDNYQYTCLNTVASKSNMATLAKDKPFYVPTIDIAPYLSNPHSAAAGKIIKDVRAACISTGFFQIVGHGVPKHLQRSIFEAAAGFFALSYDEKVKLDASKSVGHRGYDVLASQSYEEGVLPDLKEVRLLDSSNLYHATRERLCPQYLMFIYPNNTANPTLFQFILTRNLLARPDNLAVKI